MSIKPGSPKHQSCNEPTKKHPQHDENDLPTTDTKKITKFGLIPTLPPIGSRLLEVSFSWIFWIIGGDSNSAGHKLLGYVFDWLAVVCFLLLAADLLFSAWQSRKPILIAFGLSCLLSAGYYGWLYSRPSPTTAVEPKPVAVDLLYPGNDPTATQTQH